MRDEWIQEVWKRAFHRCEYCRVPYPHYRLPFQIDHIIARQHGGTTELNNLALACFHCNRHKGPNVAGWDAKTADVVRLFHPRRDRWIEHFQFVGNRIMALGRVTIQVLAMNDLDSLAVRRALRDEGLFMQD